MKIAFKKWSGVKNDCPKNLISCSNNFIKVFKIFKTFLKKFKKKKNERKMSDKKSCIVNDLQKFDILVIMDRTFCL